VLSSLSIIIGIVLVICFLNITEALIPPKEEDYKELHYLEENVSSNFDNVYSMDNARVFINEENIIVEITAKHSTDYKISMEFDKERNFIESNEICTKQGYQTYSSTFENILNKIWFVLSWLVLTMFFICITYLLLCMCDKIFSFVSKKIVIILNKRKIKA